MVPWAPATPGMTWQAPHPPFWKAAAATSSLTASSAGGGVTSWVTMTVSLTTFVTSWGTRTVSLITSGVGVGRLQAPTRTPRTMSKIKERKGMRFIGFCPPYLLSVGLNVGRM